MTELSRRNAAKRLATAAAMAAAPASVMARPGPPPRIFPKGFVWGCATAAYQIEGAVNEDGRGPSIWDVFAHTPGNIKAGATADIACDSYHRYGQDSMLMHNLGAGAARLSFAWPRVFPAGRGPLNHKALDHYKRVVDDLLQKNIRPYVTLYHWDLPAALPGGWQSRDTAHAFADYAGTIARTFSDRVKHFMTLNEIRTFIDVGYGAGIHAPGLRLSPGDLAQTRHHALLAHGLGVQAIRAHAPASTRVGLAENPEIPIPCIETPAIIDAAKKAFRVMNASYLVPILDGAYAPDIQSPEGGTPLQIAAGDMAAIGSRLDFIGANIYSGTYIEAADTPQGYRVVPGSASYPTMDLPWLKVAPEATYWGARLLTELWNPKSIYVTENGSAADDHLSGDTVNDADRIMYLRNYLSNVQRATSEGYPVDGYFLWSLLDNFEWAEGFSTRFGLYYTDFETQQRTPKTSASWYKNLIARNALV